MARTVQFQVNSHYLDINLSSQEAVMIEDPFHLLSCQQDRRQME